MSVHPFHASPAHPSRGGGEPPYDGCMEARVVKLVAAMREVRDRLVRIETHMESFESRFATKEDMHREMHIQTWRILGVAGLLVTAVYFIARYVH